MANYDEFALKKLGYNKLQNLIFIKKLILFLVYLKKVTLSKFS